MAATNGWTTSSPIEISSAFASSAISVESSSSSPMSRAISLATTAESAEPGASPTSENPALPAGAPPRHSTCQDWSMDQPAAELANIRASIDAIDAQVVKLLAAREALVRQAAPLKADTDAVRAPARAQAVVDRAGQLARQ